MGVLNFLLHKIRRPSTPQVVLFDDFADNTNGWVNASNTNPVLRQTIRHHRLFLESSTDEMGVASSTTLALNTTKDFSIEASLLLRGHSAPIYASIDFGIARQTVALRNISGVNVQTSFGDRYYYFGYSNSQEIIVAEWNQGEETFLFRGQSEAVRISKTNLLRITKTAGVIQYFLNRLVATLN